MKTELVHFLFPMSVLLLGGALEELLPKAFGVGLPVLMTAAVVLGVRASRTDCVLWALLAGLLEDALSGLPFATTASFLLLILFAARFLEASRPAILLAYPLYQFWLVVWTTLPAGEVWTRLIVSLPFAALAAWTIPPVLRFLERRAAADAR